MSSAYVAGLLSGKNAQAATETSFTFQTNNAINTSGALAQVKYQLDKHSKPIEKNLVILAKL